MEAIFDFEKPIVNLEKKLVDLRELARQEGVDFSKEVAILEQKMARLIDETFAKLTPWQRIQLSRHPNRPHTGDYLEQVFPDFMELKGDRAFSDDQAIVAGVATWPPVLPEVKASQAEGGPYCKLTGKNRIPILIVGHQKGRSTKQKMERNFAMARPDGYRKAIRLMQLAERSRMPILTFIDTPGAYPGLDAEERGQSQAIAQSIEEMFRLTVPVASVVIGEGGSGGALAVGIANLVMMQEYSYYSVISPESCAAILWSDSSLAERAAEKLRISANDLLRMEVIDGIVREPLGGAHRDRQLAASLLRDSLLERWGPMIQAHLQGKPSGKDFRAERIEKFRKMGSLALEHAPVQAGA